MEKKIKTLRVSLLLSILCAITSGINYLVSQLPIVGIMFILIIVALITQVISYKLAIKALKK